MKSEVPKKMDDVLREAIAGQRLIQFKLHGCLRIAEPHDYGIRKGEVQLLVYQIGGQSNSRTLPNWRWAKVSAMSELQVLATTFAGGRPQGQGAHASWDKLFIRVNAPKRECASRSTYA